MSDKHPVSHFHEHLRKHSAKEDENNARDDKSPQHKGPNLGRYHDPDFQYSFLQQVPSQSGVWNLRDFRYEKTTHSLGQQRAAGKQDIM